MSVLKEESEVFNLVKDHKIVVGRGLDLINSFPLTFNNEKDGDFNIFRIKNYEGWREFLVYNSDDEVRYIGKKGFSKLLLKSSLVKD